MLDVLFPRKCVGCGKKGGYFCKNCRGDLAGLRWLVCPECSKRAIGGVTHALCEKTWGLDGLVSAFKYVGLGRVAIKKLKFRFVFDLTAELVGLAVEEVVKLDMGEYFEKGNFVVVAVPLFIKRERWRGFNQAEKIGVRLAGELGLEYWPGVLERVRNTSSQSELKVNLNRKEMRELKSKSVSDLDYEDKLRLVLKRKKLEKRWENVRGAFALNKKLNLKNQKLPKKILLADDVWTSGATMKECARVLKRNGAGEVWGFTVAQ